MKKNLRRFLFFLIICGIFGPAVISSAQSVGFSAPTNFAVGSNPTSVVLGDFNGDGKQDLAVAVQTSGNVSILLGNGNGSFGAPTNHAVGVYPFSVGIGDFNGDGKQDLAVANLASGSVSILLGNGDGGFGAVTNFAAGDSPRSVVVGDFNGDGNQDLAVANAFSGLVSILLGNGAGSFGAATSFALGNALFSVAVGDFNNDGKQDLVMGGDPNVPILLGNGDGSFGAPTNLAVGFLPLSVAVGDFNADGKQDLAVSNRGSGNVSILLGNGDGSFTGPTNFAVGAFPSSVAVGDFNGDGKQDLVVANDTTGSVSILLGNGDGSFTSATNFAAGGGSQSVAIGDFNGDGKQDLAVANYGSDNVSILLNVPAIFIGDVTISEGNAGTATASFQVSLSEPSTQTVMVTFSTANSTATAGSDYVATSGTVTFNPGETVKTITIEVKGDTLNEAHETFLVNLSNPVMFGIGDGQGLGTIANDDAVSSISINDVSVTEGTVANFQVNLSAPSGQVVTVNFSTVNDTAIAGIDFIGTAGTLTFNPGETTSTITVAVIADTVVQPTRTFFVNLTSATNATIADSQGVGTIVNDDIQAAPYFPIESGTSWYYQADGERFTQTVLPGVYTINGSNTKAVEDSSGFINYFSNDEDGIRLHRQFQPNVDVGLGFPINLEATFSPPIVFAAATMAKGQTVQSGGIAQTNDLPQIGSSILSYSARFTFQGFETVTVPAGSFVAVKLQGFVGISGVVDEETIYLAENIGIVKSVSLSDGITSTTELVPPPLTITGFAPDLRSSQPVGTTVTFMATTDGGAAPIQFKWWLFNGTTWTVIRDWGAGNTFSWTPTTAGVYRIGVWARSNGNNFDAPENNAFIGYDFTIIRAGPDPTPLMITGFSPDLPSSQPAGSTIVFTATTNGGAAPIQFKWWLFNGVAWTVVRDWSAGNTFSWAPPAAGLFRIGVWARSNGNMTDAPENNAFMGYDFTITGGSAPIALTITGFTSDLPSSQPVGTTIVFTATTSGGAGPIQFKWWLFNGVSWVVVRDWSTGNTFNWTPGVASVFRIGVWARSNGNVADAPENNAFMGYDFTITGGSAPIALTITGFTSDLPSSQPLGTTVVFTATTNGGAAPIQFKWWLFNGTTWVVVRDWSAGNTFSWTPGSAGVFRIGVWARSSGNNTDAPENNAFTGYDFTITAGPVTPPLMITGFAPDLPSSQPVGTAVVFTAATSGGTGPIQYKWWFYNGSTWVVIRDWAVGNIFSWTPTSAGVFRIGVWARSNGNMADAPENNAFIGYDFTVTF